MGLFRLATLLCTTTVSEEVRVDFASSCFGACNYPCKAEHGTDQGVTNLLSMQLAVTKAFLSLQLAVTKAFLPGTCRVRYPIVRLDITAIMVFVVELLLRLSERIRVLKTIIFLIIF
jgi:hypothetical protein